MQAQRNIEIHALHWRGVDIEITYEPGWLGIDFDRHLASAHLTLTSKDRSPLPVTVTGYRSHFLHHEEVTEAGGPVGYVEGWLNHFARSREWIAYEQASRQLSLF